MQKFKISNAAAVLHDIGVRYHARGILREGAKGAALYDFYKADFVSPLHAEKLRELCPAVVFRDAFAEYAPELRGVYICFPKAEMRRRLRAGKEHVA